MKKFRRLHSGIRPGKRTAEYIDRILTRITLGGALYVAVICILPTILISRFNVTFFFGGTSLLIVVGVALDTVAQMETHLLTRNYEGFMKRGRLRVGGTRAEADAVNVILMAHRGPAGDAGSHAGERPRCAEHLDGEMLREEVRRKTRSGSRPAYMARKLVPDT